MHCKCESDFLNVTVIFFVTAFVYFDGLKEHNVRYRHTHEL